MPSVTKSPNDVHCGLVNAQTSSEINDGMAESNVYTNGSVRFAYNNYSRTIDPAGEMRIVDGSFVGLDPN